MRKHYTQFTPEEHGWAAGFVRNRIHPRAHSACTHFLDRATERHFTLDDAREALRTGRVIELHDERREWRAVVRSKTGTCVVVSLQSAKVVTVYYNAPEDEHATLNHELYRAGRALDVIQLVKQLMHRK